MKSKTRTFWLIFLIAIIVIVYCYSGFIYYLKRPYLTFNRGWGSESISDSKKERLFIGEYKPLKTQVKLKDGTTLNVKNAWAEYQFRYKTLGLYFIHIKQKTKGFYLVIPPLEGKSNYDNSSYKLVYFLDLFKDDEKYTSSPGFGFEEKLGYQVYLDKLPHRIRFNLIQKEHEDDSWEKAKTIDTIVFIKHF